MYLFLCSVFGENADIMRISRIFFFYGGVGVLQSCVDKND